jgi:hypothetical protein
MINKKQSGKIWKEVEEALVGSLVGSFLLLPLGA